MAERSNLIDLANGMNIAAFKLLIENLVLLANPSVSFPLTQEQLSRIMAEQAASSALLETAHDLLLIYGPERRN